MFGSNWYATSAVYRMLGMLDTIFDMIISRS